MNYLFEPVRFEDKPLLFAHKTRTTADFSGFYHWHQCCEILFIHEGKGSVIVNQKTYEMRRGLLFFFQPYQLHKVFASVSGGTPYVRTVLHFDPYFFENSLRSFPNRYSQFVQNWKVLMTETGIDVLMETDYIERALEMFARTKQFEKGIDEEDMTMLMLQLVQAVMSRSQMHSNHALEDKSFRPFAYSEKMMLWIEEHYAEEIRLDDLAESLHLSKFYLSRLFQRETGSSLSDYIMARRIKQACRLLYTTVYSVEQVAAEVGYPNVSYFIRLFKKVMGTTPLKYRSSAR